MARRLSALTGFYGYALDEGLIERSPLAGGRRLRCRRQPDHRARWWPAPSGASRGPAAGGDRAGQSVRDLGLVTLLAYNSLRIGDALASEVEDLGTSGGIGPF